ncbi:ribosomal L7Ae/L30e/S12e/Gadd45 family protein [Allofournierella sp.]|uniref:ribosomal L7Ae/L30e/S12e/Gadd45 family protein n=1 Tax=Allofournierella sp. TaxID=1940256 RepID=UPI00208BA394|nr:hypothetical protein CE91St44_05250 [Oscillospiraceae bacterium]
MEQSEQKLFSALSLCRKAGKLVLGFDAVTDSVYGGKAALVLLAADASDGTAKRMGRSCEGLVPCRRMPLTQQALCAITYKKVGVYAVTDDNLAILCINSLEHEKEENA